MNTYGFTRTADSSSYGTEDLEEGSESGGSSGQSLENGASCPDAIGKEVLLTSLRAQLLVAAQNQLKTPFHATGPVSVTSRGLGSWAP